MVIREDTGIWPVLIGLQQCLCEQIADSGLDEPCFCGILPGATATGDYLDGCEGGVAWVRLASTFPSATLPAQEQRMARHLVPLASTIEVGIVRPAQQVLEGGEAPTQEMQFDWARNQMAEQAAMYRAIMCCLGQFRHDYVVGLYTPQGPNGSLIGGTWSLTVGHD